MRWLKKALSGIEVVVAGLLLLCVVLSLVSPGIEMVHDTGAGTLATAPRSAMLADRLADDVPATKRAACEVSESRVTDRARGFPCRARQSVSDRRDRRRRR